MHIVAHEPDPAADMIAGLVAAVQKGGMTAESVAAVKELTALYERMQDRDARKQFNAALAAFQAKCPKIPRTKQAGKATSVGQRSGASFSYTYFGLDDIAATIDPYVREHGFSYSFDRAMSEGGKDLLVTCIVRHVGGHEERTTFPIPAEGALQSGSSAQKREAADTYGMRRALCGAFGLTWVDPDPEETKDDGPRLSEDQVIEIEELLEVNGITGKRLLKFKDFYDVESIKDLPAKGFEEIKAKISEVAAHFERKGQ